MKLSHPAIFLASWLGSGFLKPAPGTWGSLAALPFGLALSYYSGITGLLLGIALIFIIGLWSAAIFEEQSGVHDDKRIVIDEVAGQWIALIPAAFNPLLILLAFISFRFFDILKPWPIGYIDKKVEGAFGVMFDDIIAGIFAGFIVLGVRIYAG